MKSLAHGLFEWSRSMAFLEKVRALTITRNKVQTFEKEDKLNFQYCYESKVD